MGMTIPRPPKNRFDRRSKPKDGGTSYYSLGKYKKKKKLNIDYDDVLKYLIIGFVIYILITL